MYESIKLIIYVILSLMDTLLGGVRDPYFRMYFTKYAAFLMILFFIGELPNNSFIKHNLLKKNPWNYKNITLTFLQHPIHSP